MAEFKRLDVALHEQGLAESRSKAKSLIESGQVYVNGVACQKCACSVGPTDTLEIRGEGSRFVSRGGYKLLKAMETFHINIHDHVCMDVGASTGGFTDCMLQHGAQRVYAIDVGTNQLVASLREDPRVISMEQCNFRHVKPNDLPEAIQFASVDVSFISLEKILPPLFSLLSANGRAVCLIKPQFEAGKENLGKNGIVKNLSVHQAVIRRVMQICLDLGFSVLGLTHSPMKGAQGNVEYLLYLQVGCQQEMTLISQDYVKQTVNQAHKELSDKE